MLEFKSCHTCFLYYLSDCQDYFEQGETQSGIYYIRPSGSVLPAFSVWCTFGQNRGWTVIQRNLNGAENFDRLWHDYKKGFGDITGEHYLGEIPSHYYKYYQQ